MTSTQAKEWLTVADVAQRMGMSKRTATREFPYWYRMSKRRGLRARPDDVDRFIASRATFKAKAVR